MNRLYLIARVRSLTRDFSNSIFREADIVAFLNEGVERFKQAIPQFRNEVVLDNNNAEPLLIPSYYHHILSVYASARCFSQDERHYQATTLMNEFEVKLEELKSKIESGEIVIKDPETGEDITTTNTTDYVYDNYFTKKNYDSDDELLLESDV